MEEERVETKGYEPMGLSAVFLKRAALAAAAPCN
ncbi:hypothetical protein COLO4_33724 [Corchorus olitorius]|uniref:Uncharacterized protein n=1 Tax=Corchorus olitorius TaxID=93759 RepID=A0A1R3GRU3_9ROSI|nr:hypothetical protein COLO4_33724 [Corchorus olitorius]